MRPLRYLYLGRQPYQPVWDQQRDLAERLRRGHSAAVETLFAVEHEPVITIGRRGRRQDVLWSEEALRARAIAVVQVDRGGEVCYHGPGQLVLYPVVRVEPARFGVGDLVRGLAAAVSDLLAALGISASYDPANPGLWVASAKICAVGMRVAGGVSTHGAALNVRTELDAFSAIVPCGEPGAAVTSVVRELGAGADVPELEALGGRVAQAFGRRLGFAPVTSG